MFSKIVAVSTAIPAVATVFRNLPQLRSLGVSPFVFIIISWYSVASAGAEPCEPEASVEGGAEGEATEGEQRGATGGYGVILGIAHAETGVR